MRFLIYCIHHLTDTILYVADSADKFPFVVRRSMLEAALGCAVFGAQRAMLQNRLFKVWDEACWDVEVSPMINLRDKIENGKVSQGRTEYTSTTK